MVTTNTNPTSKADRKPCDLPVALKINTLPTTVIKVGGNALTSKTALDDVCALAARARRRARVVVVHGGGPDISKLYRLAGLPIEMRDGLRVTTRAGARLVATALSGHVGPRLVSALQRSGVRATAVSGFEHDVLHATYLDRVRLGQVGDTPRVNPMAVEHLLERGIVPVIAPLSRAPEGEILNVNGDLAAAVIARALCAQQLDLVTTGQLRDAAGKPIDRLATRAVQQLIADEVATDGMIPKLNAAQLALRAEQGSAVRQARIGSFDDFERGQPTCIEPDQACASRMPATA